MLNLGIKLQKAFYTFRTVHIGWHSATVSDAQLGSKISISSWKMAVLTDFSVSDARV
jgi:hypothetical protein